VWDVGKFEAATPTEAKRRRTLSLAFFRITSGIPYGYFEGVEIPNKHTHTLISESTKQE